MKMPLLNLSLSELQEKVTLLGEKKFRAKQIFDCILSGKDLEKCNVPEALVSALANEYELHPVSIFKQISDSTGDTTKFLFKLTDNQIVEGVLMTYKYGNSFCLSTQIGCRMNCSFCASGLGGLVRNLYAGEMLAIIILVNSLDKQKDRNITNIVLMGSGEPLDNFDEVVNFLNLITNKDGLNFSARGISISTCGLVDKIRLLPEVAPPVTLSVSLHASNNNARLKIMPVTKKYSIKEVVSAAKYYFDKTGRRVAFEYALIKGINDSDKNAEELAKLLKNVCCFVNLINLNPVKERNLEGLTTKEAYIFAEKLKKHGLTATVRRIMGSDIEGACGQLRNKHMEGECDNE